MIRAIRPSCRGATTITRRAILPIALALSTLSGLAPAHPTAAASPLQGLGVQLPDVARAYGTGFTLAYAMPISKKIFQSSTITVSGVKTSMAGFTGGYGASYIRMSSATQGSGAYSVSSTIGQYTSAGAPRRNMDQVLAHLDQLTRGAGKYASQVKASSLQGVGDQAILETSKVKQSRPAYATLVLFRRGRYTESLVVLSRGSGQSQPAIALAKVVDARLQHAG